MATPQRRHSLVRLPPLLVVLVCTSCLLTTAESRSRDKEGRRRNDRVSLSSSSSSSASASSQYHTYASSSNYNPPAPAPASVDTTGFCTRRRDMKLMCYCTPDENHVSVQKAECWVFADDLLQNDTTWTRFFQQKRLRDLKFVVQNHGRLDFIPTMILEPLKNLSSISIEYSQVEVVRSYALANLAHLERVVLTNNQIIALDQEAFANHVRLRELNLEHNQIFEMDRQAFRNLPLCERLFLNNNNISNLHDGLFADLVRLVYLNLAHNQISVLTSEIFKGLGNLNVLKLTHNNINFIGDTVFAELWSLMELELDDNRIERISERALDGLNNLKTLNLRNNLLKKIDNGLLRGTPALLSINVQSNDLETLTFYTFQPIMDNLVNSTSELLLSDNNFICDCRLQWIYELRNRTRHLQLRDSLEDLVCTLQEPHLYNFVEPVPNHILDLLNIGSFSGSRLQTGEQYLAGGGANGNSNGDGNGRRRMSKGRQGGQRRQRVEDPTQLTADENSTTLRERRKKRAPTDAGKGGGGGSGSVGSSSSSSTTVESHYIFGGSSSSNLHSPSLHSDFFDESHSGVAGVMSQQATAEEELDLMKQNALFQQHNEVLGSASGAIDNHVDNVDAIAKYPLAFKVRLFALKSDRLPCHEELSDPTELPLSRDLMDVRSSNVLNSSASKAVPSAFAQPPITTTTTAILLVIVGLAQGVQVG